MVSLTLTYCFFVASFSYRSIALPGIFKCPGASLLTVQPALRLLALQIVHHSILRLIPSSLHILPNLVNFWYLTIKNVKRNLTQQCNRYKHQHTSKRGEMDGYDENKIGEALETKSIGSPDKWVTVKSWENVWHHLMWMHFRFWNSSESDSKLQLATCFLMSLQMLLFQRKQEYHFAWNDMHMCVF